MFQCSKYEISSTPKGGLTATKQKLPSLPSDYAELTISSPDKDIVDPIYEDVDSSVQQPKDANSSVQQPKDVDSSVQQSKDVADTDVKIEDNPAYETSML